MSFSWFVSVDRVASPAAVAAAASLGVGGAVVFGHHKCSDNILAAFCARMQTFASN